MSDDRRQRAFGVKTGAAAIAVIGSLSVSSSLCGQNLASRVSAVSDGQVRMSFAARPDVCGNGRDIATSHASRDWEPWCESGPIRVVIWKEGGSISDIDTYVGGRWRAVPSAIDLGMVSSSEAARLFLAIARQAPDVVGKDAIVPAVLADSVVIWPELLSLAKDESRPRAVRKSAVFWISQAAGDAATEGLEAIVEDSGGDREVRKSAVFALSQIESGGVPALIRIARNHRDPAIRKQAIFWLGQSSDPRAVALFEELLTRH